MDQLLIQRDQSLLLLIDVQEKLAPLCDNKQLWQTNIAWLMAVANRLSVPIIATEQYPQGLGKTLPQLHSLVTLPILEKLHFSCASDSACLQAILAQKRQQLILTGIESHVCVMQTAIECLAHEMDVFVVIDAISARSQVDHKMALKRMTQAGIHLVTREMVVFEWLRKAGTDEFKAISKEFLR